MAGHCTVYAKTVKQDVASKTIELSNTWHTLPVSTTVATGACKNNSFGQAGAAVKTTNLEECQALQSHTSYKPRGIERVQ